MIDAGVRGSPVLSKEDHAYCSNATNHSAEATIPCDRPTRQPLVPEFQPTYCSMG